MGENGNGGLTVHRTGPASCMPLVVPAANFGNLCRLVALIVAGHGHNFKGRLGNPTKKWAPTLLRPRYKSKGWSPSCVRTCHKPRPPTRPLLAFHTTVIMFSSYPHNSVISQDQATLPPLQSTTYPIQPTGIEVSVHCNRLLVISQIRVAGSHAGV